MKARECLEIIDVFKRKVNEWRLVKKISSLGKGARVTGGVIVFGGNNISIGDGFCCAGGNRIEAWSFVNGEKFTPSIKIGNDFVMQFNNHITCINEIRIGNGVLLGSNITISDNNHGHNILSEAEIPPNRRKLSSKGKISIGNNVWIADNAVILSGVTVGDNVVIGAGAIVSKDIPDNSVVVGNPATVIKTMK